MSNLALDTAHDTRPRAGRRAYIGKTGITFFAGGLVGVDANGFLDKWANTATLKFQGILLAGFVGDAVLLGRVNTNGDTIMGATVDSSIQASVNALVYVSTDNPADFSLTATSAARAVGWYSKHDSAGVGEVTLFTPEEYQSLNDLSQITSLTDSSGGTGTDTLAAHDVAMVAVGGSGMSTAQESEYNATMTVIRNSISSLRDKIEEILAR